MIELQTALAASLIGGDDVTAAEAAVHVRHGKLSPARRLEIYRHNVLSNLRGALQDIYPVVNRIVGDAFFLHAADQFIRETPSLSGDLNQFGREWPAFLAAYPHAQELPYLPDVARLEWAWHECFPAAGTPPLDPARLAALAAVPADEHAELRFTLHPAVRLIASAHPLLQIWQVNQPGYAGELGIDWEKPGDALLLRREDVEVVIEAISPAAYAFLSAVAAGQGLESAAEAAFTAVGDAGEFDLQGFLSASVTGGVIVDFVRPRDEPRAAPS
jgi:hypothetical protein